MIAGGLIYGAAGGVDGENPVVILGILVLVAGFFVYFRGRQKAARARAVGPQSPLTDTKPDVLYLRSFSADPSSVFKILQSGFTDEEEQLADVLRPFGDLIAIGRPGERLPLPGATRMYVSDADWQRVVLERMRVAPLVVIRAGTGEGLLWELGQAVRTLNPENILILVLNITADDYGAFARRIQRDVGLHLPTLERFGILNTLVDLRDNSSKIRPGFVTFSRGWTSEFLPMPSTIVRTGYNDLRKSFSVALRPVFERYGVGWHAVGRFGG
jgi:hypothetical protein